MADTTTQLDNYKGTGTPGSKGWLIPKKTDQAIPGHVLVGIDAAGLGINGGDDAGTVFGGVSRQDYAIADASMYVIRHGIFAFEVAGGSAAADLGRTVYMEDNQTVGLDADSTNKCACGRIVAWDTDDGIWVAGALALVDIAIGIVGA